MPSPSLIASLKRHEGLRLKSYQDTVGVWTIGYGRNLEQMTIDPATAEAWLIEDATKYEKAVDLIPWVKGLTPNRRDVLIEMAFNLGMKGLLGFQRTLASIEAGEYDRAAKEMLQSKWARQVGKRANTLADKMRKG